MTQPMKKGDMDISGALFGVRFREGGSTGLVELYIEDDENYFLKATFDRLWLSDLDRVVKLARERVGKPDEGK